MTHPPAKKSPAAARTPKKALPPRTTRDSVSLMFRRGISHKHNKGKARLMSTQKTITKEEFKKIGDNFALIYDHDLCKQFAPLLNIISVESNPKNERFYVSLDKLDPSYVAVPFVPKTKTREKAPADVDMAGDAATQTQPALEKPKAIRKKKVDTDATAVPAASTAAAPLKTRGKKATSAVAEPAASGKSKGAPAKQVESAKKAASKVAKK